MKPTISEETNNAPTRPSGRVRAAEERDVGQIAELHQKTFGPARNADLDALRSHLLEVFCHHPWRSEDVPSLVYEDFEGRVVGCLGVVPRRMRIEDEPVRCAVSHNFMVEPGHRSTMAAFAMLKRFLAGPQDLSLAEGNDASKKMWEKAGGETSSIRSLQWVRPLRPAGYLRSLARGRGVPRTLVRGLRPLSTLADRAARRLMPPLHGGARDRGVDTSPLDVETLWSSIRRVSGKRALRPDYDIESLGWLLGFLARRTTRGTLRNRLVRDGEDAIGWYVYYVRAGAVGEIVQMGAVSASATPRVLARLFEDAFEQGAVAVTGQLDSSLLPALSSEPCFFKRGARGTWLLFHSGNDRVLRSFYRDDLFLTRLEGEWWIGA